MHDSWSGKVCIKHAKFGSDYKTTKSYLSDKLHLKPWDLIKRIWQLLHSYLTIKSDKKSPQQQAHELYPFLPSCSLSLSQLKFWALFPSTSLIGQQVCQLSSSDWLLLSSRQLELDVWQSLHQAVEKQHHRECVFVWVCVCVCISEGTSSEVFLPKGPSGITSSPKIHTLRQSWATLVYRPYLDHVCHWNYQNRTRRTNKYHKLIQYSIHLNSSCAFALVAAWKLSPVVWFVWKIFSMSCILFIYLFWLYFPAINWLYEQIKLLKVSLSQVIPTISAFVVSRSLQG